uniref:Kinesin family member 14 n=1 Tax=Myotis lucifugus TaxID=59463 RepID=G1P7S3_MYOLU
MSVYTAQRGPSSGLPGAPASQRSSSPDGLGLGSSRKQLSSSDVSERENDDPFLRSARKLRDINSTYVISACKAPGDAPLTPNPAGRLTLQRRVTRNKESSLLGSEVGESSERKTETRLKRTTAKADSTTQSVGGAAASDGASRDTSRKVRIVSNKKNSPIASSAPSPEDGDTGLVADEKDRGTFSALRGANDSVTREYFSHSTPIRPQKEAEEARPGRLATKPFQSPLDVRASGTGSWHHRNLGEDVAKSRNEFESLGRGTPAKRTAGHTWTPRRGTPQPQSAAMSTLRPRTPSSQGQQKPKRSLFANKREGSHKHTLPPTEEAAAQSASTERDPLKAENSQVTVAVRVRPFSKREKDEDAAQVVFLDGEEIAVRHPDLRQAYSFLYDVSFWSFDECHPRYAGQAAVYQTLAAPLLARALEGYNACLFAYGQTGSGKSYTMMGFGEEPGIIPRFCEDLFAQVAKHQTQEVRYHLEMSFFEVYNEKIHDLLVGRGDGRQGKQALRVREHPVSGPYVEALAVNAVGSYSDIQGWLQLGSKQRATAATGMNDKSSRSHSVLTLLLTRTQTRSGDGNEQTTRDHCISLLAWRQQAPGSGGLHWHQEGVSINKSLLTLGKVISALAEHGGRRRAFIPYRESVLTWQVSFELSFVELLPALWVVVAPEMGDRAVECLSHSGSLCGGERYPSNRVGVKRVVVASEIRETEKTASRRWKHSCRPGEDRRGETTPHARHPCPRWARALCVLERAWKEKFEQAEQRKHHEIKELQKAGITFQVDNRLPNLVNLSEDPQLSETLLYVIREGTTAVGKRGPTSRPDIQLSGALVADEHCTISHVDGTVSIAPVGEARTYVNGTHVLGPTVLHHGDRVVLGGDHYFRFNHPAEVRSGKRPPGGGAPASEGPKDFEFAKNEWLAAQRSHEFGGQRWGELQGEGSRRLQEMSNQEAHLRIEELERVKQRLEQEVQANRRRLQLERLAAQQALEDHSVRHTRILEALEAEKQKIAQEVQALQQNQGSKDRAPPVPTSWGSLKLSLMIQEANALSSRSQRQYVFGRHEAPDRGGGSGPRVRVRNLRLGVSTLWSLEKFESKLAALKELDESNCQSEDLFCDPEDEWEPDLTDAPAASFSRRRSRSLVKNRRVSGYLHDIQAHAAPSLPSSRSSGSGEKPGSLGSSSAASSLPGICRELIGSSLAVLGRSGEEETVADGLVDSLLRVHGLLAISQAHAAQDEDSPDDLFSADRAAQARAVQVACAFGQLAVLAPLWPGDAPPGPHAARLAEELRQEVEKLGSYVQMFLQGCSSDIPSMVTDAQSRATQAVRQAVACAGQLAVLSGSRLRLLDPGAYGGADAQEDLVDALWDGVGAGVRLLIDSGLERAAELRRELSGQHPQSEAAQQLRAKAEALIRCLETIFAEWRTESSRTRAQGEPSGGGAPREMADRAPEMLNLTRCLEQTIEAVVSALRGRRGDGGALRTCVERVCVLAGGGATDSCAQSRGDLTSAAKSLLLCFEAEDRPDLSEPWDACPQNSRTGPAAGRGVYALPSRPPRSSGERAPSGTQWV